MPRPIFCTISIAAMQHNLALAQTMAAPRRSWAVIKANAYGHGIDRALQGFGKADGLAMLDFKDAQACRQAGWTAPILMLEGAFDAQDMLLAGQSDLALVVHSQHQLDWLLATSGPQYQVHLKVNTGMNRLGFSPAQADIAYASLVASQRTSQIVWTTHFANADTPDIDHNGVTPNQQLAMFAHAHLGSVANSAGLLSQRQPSMDGKSLHADAGWVRPGIALYGSSPFASRSARSLGLEPAMALTAKIIAIQHLRKGDQVGYGSSFIAPDSMRIGIVSCGYADGYPRHAATGTPIGVDGVRTKTIGRVSMDMLAVDITAIGSAAIGSNVELWGGLIPIDDVASAAGTIGYELMCAVATRVQRRTTQEFLSSVTTSDLAADLVPESVPQLVSQLAPESELKTRPTNG